MRRIFGAALTGAGLAILAAVGIVYAKGRIARDQARTQWEVLEAHGAVAAVARQVDRVEDRAAPARGAPVARIVIPAIGVDEVVVEGVDQDQLAAGPGHLPRSALPGDSGNAVISAHRDRQFHGLDQGDVDELRGLVSSKVVVAPASSLPGDAHVVATSWVTRQVCTAVDVGQLRHFVEARSGKGPGRS